MDNDLRWFGLIQALIVLVITLVAVAIYNITFYPLQQILANPLRLIPNPGWYTLVMAELKLWISQRVLKMELHYDHWHQIFGPVVRIGLNTISVTDSEFVTRILKDKSMEVKGVIESTEFSSLCESTNLEQSCIFDEKELVLIEPKIIVTINRFYNNLEEQSMKNTGMMLEKNTLINQLISNITAITMLGLDPKKMSKYRFECIVDLIHARRKYKHLLHKYPILAKIPFSPIQSTYDICNEELKRKIYALIEDAETDENHRQAGSLFKMLISCHLERVERLMRNNPNAEPAEIHLLRKKTTKEILALIFNTGENLFTCLNYAFDSIFNDKTTLQQIEEEISQVINREYLKIDLKHRGKKRVTFEEKCKYHLLTLNHIKAMDRFERIVQRSVDYPVANGFLRCNSVTTETPLQLGPYLIPGNTEIRIPLEALKYLNNGPVETKEPLKLNSPQSTLLNPTEFTNYTSQKLVFVITQDILAILITRYRLGPYRKHTGWQHLIPTTFQVPYHNNYIELFKRTKA